MARPGVELLGPPTTAPNVGLSGRYFKANRFDSQEDNANSSGRPAAQPLGPPTIAPTSMGPSPGPQNMRNTGQLGLSGAFFDPSYISSLVEMLRRSQGGGQSQYRPMGGKS